MPGLDTRVKQCVRRQVEGDNSQRSIGEVVRSLRQFSHGISLIKELADFEAHREERNKGIVTEIVRDHFYVLDFKAPHFADQNYDLPIPHYYGRALKYIFNGLSDQHMMEEIGMKRKVAFRLLTSALGKSRVGELPSEFKLRLGPEEAAVVTMCSSYILAHNIFTDDTLIRDYANVLLKNDLIKAKDIKPIHQLKDDLALYSLSLMHNKILIITDKSVTQLRLQIDFTGMLALSAASEFETKLHGKKGWFVTVAQTNMRAEDWLDPIYFDNGQIREDEFEFQHVPELDLPLYRETGELRFSKTFVHDIEIVDRKVKPLI